MKGVQFSLILLFLLAFAGLAFSEGLSTTVDYKFPLADVPKSGLEVSGTSSNIVCFSSTDCSYVLKVKNESIKDLTDLTLKPYFSSAPNGSSIIELVEETVFLDAQRCSKFENQPSIDKNGLESVCTEWVTEKIGINKVVEKPVAQQNITENRRLDSKNYSLSKQSISSLNSGEERTFKISFNPSTVKGQIAFVAESLTETSIKGSLDPWWDASFIVVESDTFTGANGTDINTLGKWSTKLTGVAGCDGNFKIQTDQGYIQSGPLIGECSYRVFETVPRSTATDKNWQWRMKWVTDSDAALTMRIISGDSNNLGHYFAGSDINEIVIQQYFAGTDDGIFVRNKKVSTTVPTDGQVVTIRLGRVGDTNKHFINVFYDSTEVYADYNYLDVTSWKFAMSTGSTNIQASLTVDDFNVAYVVAPPVPLPYDFFADFNYFYFNGINYLDQENGLDSVIVDFNNTSNAGVFDFNGGQGLATDNNMFWDLGNDANSVMIDTNAEFVKAGTYAMKVDMNYLKSANSTSDATYNSLGNFDLTDWNNGTVSFWFCIPNKTVLGGGSGTNAAVQFLFLDNNTNDYEYLTWELSTLNNGCTYLSKNIHGNTIKIGSNDLNWNEIDTIRVRVREAVSTVNFSFWFDDLKITNQIIDYNWYVNNVLFSTDANTQRIFSTNGDYNVMLKVKDINGNDSNRVKTVSVYQSLQGLSIDLNSSTIISSDLNAQFDVNITNGTGIDTWWWQRNNAYVGTSSGLHQVITSNGDYNYCITAQTTGNDINKIDCVSILVTQLIVKKPIDGITSVVLTPFTVSIDTNASPTYTDINNDVYVFFVGTVAVLHNIIVDKNAEFSSGAYSINTDGSLIILQPYLFPFGTSSAVKFIVQNELNEPIPNVIFNVSKLIGGVKTLISSSITDATGISLFFLSAGDMYYIDMNYNGKLVFSTSNYVLTTSPVYFYINTLTNYGNITSSNIINVSFNPFVEFIQSGILNIKIDINGSSANYAVLKFYKFPNCDLNRDRNYFYVTSKLCPGTCNFTTLVTTINYDANCQFYAQVTVFSDNNASQRVWEKRYSKFSTALNPINLFINARKDFGCSTDTNLPCPLTTVASIILIILAIGAIAIKFGFSSPTGLGVLALMGLAFFTYVGWFYWIAFALIAVVLVIGLIGKGGE